MCLRVEELRGSPSHFTGAPTSLVARLQNRIPPIFPPLPLSLSSFLPFFPRLSVHDIDDTSRSSFVITSNMAPRLRAKPNTHARIQRCLTQFNELDVTPNRPGEKTEYPEANKTDSSPNDSNAGAIHVDKDEQPVKSFAWSDGGSTTNNTRRSSPADLGELSTDDVWDFEESLAPFSSPTSEKDHLPDTMPLASTEQNDPSCTPTKKVDFSETASTIYRSSSFVGGNEPKDIWNFDDSPTDSSPISETSKKMPTLSSEHLPADELYDLTPKKAVPTPAAAKPNGSQPVVNDETKSCSSKPTLQPKEKKQRPKAKKPIRFDSLTQEILEEPISKKRKKQPAPARLPIVNALRESAKSSSSPVAGSEKPKPKRKRPQKKVKPEIPPIPKNPPKPRAEDVITFLDSSAQLVAKSPSEYLPELPSTRKGEDSRESHSASSGDDFAAIQEPKQQHRRVPAAIDRQDTTLNESGAIFVEQQYGAKRRRLSRQFSVSEKGSPVVANDVMLPNNIQSVPVNPHPPMSGGPELSITTQPSSFLRSTSSGKQIEQQHSSAFGDINGKSSSQWLRRVSDKAPVPKRKPSIGKKLHDEIMKSFLGQTEAEQEPQEPEAKSAPAASPNHVETQIRQAVNVSSIQQFVWEVTC